MSKIPPLCLMFIALGSVYIGAGIAFGEVRELIYDGLIVYGVAGIVWLYIIH